MNNPSIKPMFHLVPQHERRMKNHQPQRIERPKVIRFSGIDPDAPPPNEGALGLTKAA